MLQSDISKCRQIGNNVRDGTNVSIAFIPADSEKQF